MKITLSIIKADIGSIGGHLQPSDKLLNTIEEHLNSYGNDQFIDFYLGYTGDDVFILLTHRKGINNRQIHQLAWDTFMVGTATAKKQRLYGAGQDLLSDSFSGNIKGLGPAVAEMEIEERENEPFLVFTADKTDPGAYNLPLYLSFCDPMHNPGLLLSPKIGDGFTFTVMDVSHTEQDRIIQLNTPEDIYNLAALLRDNERFVVESIHSRKSQEQAAAASTTRLHHIAGKYVGKDDPVLLVRVQSHFPAVGEILSPYSIGHYVAGFMRGSHHGPLMPVKKNTTVSYFDGPPMVNALAFCVSEGKLTEPVDCFDQPFWDHIRDKVSRKSLDLREQGFSGPAMLPYSELEYGGITHKMEELEKRFDFR
ncbi:fructose-1,6-bisphosphate aldolase/phosphatase [Natranaerobius thermophilus]|uniref:Fructose-1,6-bisphosphate aldolase/phosphatase n=1 Tax=Natranaerobius thermophilus (strain ATCC BAA-1301 / DSM 18059 / JW/NM-WN-LF) TaxID=457570 RepID=B2A2Q6_NATTJ|nr:fructose-1,6-bisphosphate aldolase/phosphatase [Natranaerobius thermophilus]ACB86274.1 D-fructose 1,6-bisphosphatase [Natranaerobius thermophilus JW/NM-WN-LF]